MEENQDKKRELHPMETTQDWLQDTFPALV